MAGKFTDTDHFLIVCLLQFSCALWRTLCLFPLHSKEQVKDILLNPISNRCFHCTKQRNLTFWTLAAIVCWFFFSFFLSSLNHFHRANGEYGLNLEKDLCELPNNSKRWNKCSFSFSPSLPPFLFFLPSLALFPSLHLSLSPVLYMLLLIDYLVLPCSSLSSPFSLEYTEDQA